MGERIYLTSNKLSGKDIELIFFLLLQLCKAPTVESGMDGGRWVRGPGGDFHIKRKGVLVVTFMGYKRSFGTSEGVQSVGAFAVRFRVLSRKNITGDNVLC